MVYWLNRFFFFFASYKCIKVIFMPFLLLLFVLDSLALSFVMETWEFHMLM